MKSLKPLERRIDKLDGSRNEPRAAYLRIEQADGSYEYPGEDESFDDDRWEYLEAFCNGRDGRRPATFVTVSFVDAEQVLKEKDPVWDHRNDPPCQAERLLTSLPPPRY